MRIPAAVNLVEVGSIQFICTMQDAGCSPATCDKQETCNQAMVEEVHESCHKMKYLDS